MTTENRRRQWVPLMVIFGLMATDSEARTNSLSATRDTSRETENTLVATQPDSSLDLVAETQDPTPTVAVGDFLDGPKEILIVSPHQLDQAIPPQSLFPTETVRIAFLNELNGNTQQGNGFISGSSFAAEPGNDPYYVAYFLNEAEGDGLLGPAEAEATTEPGLFLYDAGEFLSSGNETPLTAGSDLAGSDPGGGGGGIDPLPPIFQGSEQNYVLRYVCCSQLPIIQDPQLAPDQLFSDNNIVAIPKQDEAVAVFDDLPIYNGKQIFVRVQRSQGQHLWGYFPLFWLHEHPSPVEPTEVHANASYMAIARGIRTLIEEGFYQGCNQPHPAGGEPWDVPDEAGAYQCGEFPLGSADDVIQVQGHNFRYLTHIDRVEEPQTIDPPQEAIDYPRFGFWDNDPVEGVDLHIPFYIGPLATQRRANDEYNLVELTDPKYQFYARTYWQSDEAQADENVRVHPMDWYFKTYYPDDASDHPKEVHFSIIAELPGFEVYSPWFEKEIVLFYNGGLLGGYKEARTSEISLGGMRMDELPLRIDGKVTLKTAQNGDPVDDFVQNLGYVGVEFTDVQFLRVPAITFYDGIRLKFKKMESSLLNLAIDLLVGTLNGVLGSGTENGSFGGLLFWQAAQGDLRDDILDQLKDFAPTLTQIFGDPRSRATDACSTVMPAAYKTPLSPYFAFYRNCVDFAGTINDLSFINPPDVPVQAAGSFSESSDAYAQVNLGAIPWGSAETGSKTYFCPSSDSPDGCSITFQRPWWARFDPHYVIGAELFTPGGYSYYWGTGVRAAARASGETVAAYSHFLSCLIPETDSAYNYNPWITQQTLQGKLQTACQLPALETACELYGEGEDLDALWEARWGYTPNLSGYANFCARAEALRNEGKYPTITIGGGA